jgi:uncharacterized integral membrane protein
MLQLVLAVAVTITIVLFGLANSHDVELSYIIGEPIRIRMIFLLFCVFFAGWITAYFYQMIVQVNRRRRRIRAQYDRDAE